jgi:hypothetical protein
MPAPKDHVERLTRRLTYLEKRVRDGKSQGKILSFDQGEAATIRWVLRLLAEDVPDETAILSRDAFEDCIEELFHTACYSGTAEDLQVMKKKILEHNLASYARFVGYEEQLDEVRGLCKELQGMIHANEVKSRGEAGDVTV